MNVDTRLPHFHVAFDTNLLFVDAENKLIKDALSKFIFERNEISTPRVTWHLLDIVRAERHHQMLQVALKLATQAERVGKLLGKDFGITKQSLERSIDTVIAHEVKRHDLKIQRLDTALVDWAAIIRRSVSREAPFEDGKTEKGFRDSIVLETFMQLTEEISASKAHRLVLMTNDSRLKEAVVERMRGKDYVSTVDDVPTLKSMLNAYASHIGGHELDELLEKAHRLFYREDDSESLFYKWHIEQSIRDLAGNFLLQPPPGWSNGAHVTAILSSVGPTTFVDRSDQQLTFATYLDFSVLATALTSDSQSVFGAEPYRSAANPLYPAFTTGSLFPGSGGPIVSIGTGTGPVYPNIGGSAFGVGNLLGTTSYPGSGGPSFIGTGSLSPSASTSIIGSHSLFAGGGQYRVGETGPTPNLMYRQGRKVFEIQWSATLIADELREPRQVKIGLVSTDWSL